MNVLHRAVCGAVLVLWTVAPIAAECVTVSENVPRDLREADLVFVGTLTAGGPDRLTFRPERIWKGKPKRGDIVIHLTDPAHVDAYRFETGRRYVMFANVVPEAERTFSSIDKTDVYGIKRPCGQPTWTLGVIPELNRLASGRVPR